MNRISRMGFFRGICTCVSVRLTMLSCEPPTQQPQQTASAVSWSPRLTSTRTAVPRLRPRTSRIEEDAPAPMIGEDRLDLQPDIGARRPTASTRGRVPGGTHDALRVYDDVKSVLSCVCEFARLPVSGHVRAVARLQLTLKGRHPAM